MDAREILLTHRSIRKYKDKPIEQGLLDEIITLSCRASTTGNMQVYSVVNTTDVLLKKKLAPAHFNQKMVFEAPNILTFCADFNRFNRWCEAHDASPGYDNFLSFMTAAIDVLLVSQNVTMLAEERGLGICYLGTTLYNADSIIEILHLPKGVVPITTLTIGWPDESPKLTDRLPLDAILHQETYNNYSEARINEIYAEKENLPENINYVKINNKSSLAQIFTDIRYTRNDNEYFSEKLFAVLKSQGFM